jgi:hypothetical protein
MQSIALINKLVCFVACVAGVTTEEIAIVLTGTVHTKSVAQVARTDSTIRQQDYLLSLTKWLSQTDHSLVFCENSAAQLDWLEGLQHKFPGRLEVLSFQGNSFEGNRGKGYGEALTLNHVLSSSVTVRRVEYLVKVSGRYFVTNIDAILQSTLVSNPGKHAYVETALSHGWIPSEVVIFRPAFFTKHFHWQDIDDSAQRMFEESLAAAVVFAVADGHSVGYFTCAELEGVSGTTNSPRSRQCGHESDEGSEPASDSQQLELTGAVILRVLTLSIADCISFGSRGL